MIMYVCACMYEGRYVEPTHVNVYVCRHTYMNQYLCMDGWM